MLFALGAAIAATLLLLVHNRQLVRERKAALAAEREALERLVLARKDGYEVPDAPVELGPPEEPLIAELEELISDWETESAQQAQRKYIRSLIAKGKSQMEVLRYLLPHGEVAPSGSEGAE